MFSLKVTLIVFYYGPVIYGLDSCSPTPLLLRPPPTRPRCKCWSPDHHQQGNVPLQHTFMGQWLCLPASLLPDGQRMTLSGGAASARFVQLEDEIMEPGEARGDNKNFPRDK